MAPLSAALTAAMAAGVILIIGWPHSSALPATTGARTVPEPRDVRRSSLAPLGVLALPSVLLVGLVPTIVLVALATGVAWRHRRARAARELRRVNAAMPELIDLLVIAATAGQTVPAMLDSVSRRAPHPVRPALERCTGRIANGDSVAGALAGMAPGLGELGPALVRGLVTGMTTGSPLVPTLVRMAEAARDRRRREAEAAARRLPVALLFPLVCCILPAFALLAVVPLLAASLGSLRV